MLSLKLFWSFFYFLCLNLLPYYIFTDKIDFLPSIFGYVCIIKYSLNIFQDQFNKFHTVTGIRIIQVYLKPDEVLDALFLS